MTEFTIESESLSLESHYRSIERTLPGSDRLYACLALRDWFDTVSIFDERSGECLPVQLSAVLTAVSNREPLTFPQSPQDRLGRVIHHVNKSVRRLLRGLNPRLLREHAIVPVYAAREFDSACISWLSRRNGRTIREKLAGRPYVKAVRRVESIDTPENRLFKSFCKRLSDYLQIRTECFALNEDTDSLHASITDWLRSEIAGEIGPWENFVPNNSLLQNRDYRRIWDGWQWLQSIDDTTKLDRDHFYKHWSLSFFWEMVSLLGSKCNVRWFEQPCHFDYNSFAILPAMSDADACATIRGILIESLDSTLKTGVVRKPTNEKGFGFVEIAKNDSIFFHANNFNKTIDFSHIRVGTRLAFRIEDTPKGRAAVDIAILGKPFDEIELRLNQDLSLELHLGDKTIHASGLQICRDQKHSQILINGVSQKISLSSASPRSTAELALAALMPLDFRLNTGSICNDRRVEVNGKVCAVVDLTQLRPRVAQGQTLSELPSRLLWQQWAMNSEIMAVDLGNARGVVLGDEISTVSILSLYSSANGHTSAILDEAAAYFANTIKTELNVDRITYIVPDSVDDFSLNSLRRNMNGTFVAAEPLPKSIAAVLDWQASEHFARHQVQDGDVVVIFDSIGNEASFTCLKARIDKSNALVNRVPESNGVYWERHPTQLLDIGTSSAEEAISHLQKDGCTFPESIATLCGIESLLDSTLDGLSWMNQSGEVYSYVGSWQKAYANQQIASVEDALLKADVSAFLRGIVGRNRCFAIAIGDTFFKRSSNGSCRVASAGAFILGYQVAPVRGGEIHDRWQLNAGDIPIWRDHLPDLSMRVIADGRYTPFHLVQSETVIPRRSDTSSIIIEEVFTLQGGIAVYEFPLVLGSGQQHTGFVAHLQSKAFPLKQSTPCRLKMTFTYGADNPYTLRFIPIDSNSAGFTEAVVQWRQKELSQGTGLFPIFPEPMSWSHLRAYITNAGNKVDLLKLFEDQVAILESTGDFLRSARTGLDTPRNLRQNGTVARLRSGVDRDGRNYIAGTIESKNKSYALHSFGFENVNDSFVVLEGDLVSFDVGANDKAKRITLGISVPPAIANRIRDQFVQCAGRIWNGGSSCENQDVPAGFHDVVKRAIFACRKLVNEARLRYSIDRHGLWVEVEECIDLFLCCLHGDAPDSVYDTLIDRLSESKNPPGFLKFYVRHLGYVIGAGSSPRQNQLLSRTIKIIQTESSPNVSAALEWLGIAIWRHPELVWNLPETSNELLLRKLAFVLDSDLEVLKAIPLKASRRLDFKVVAAIEPLQNHLELLMAFMRLRERGGEAAGMLAPDSKLARQFSQIIEAIDESLIRVELPLRSRIKLQLEKPEALHKTPDFLYGLRLYLTGDSAAGAIHVLGVDDDEM